MAEPQKIDPNIVSAAREYLARKAVESEPDGARDAEGIWRPNPDEERDCCKAIVPTKTLSGLLLHHCCTATHVASVYGVSSSALLAVARRIELGQEFPDQNVDEMVGQFLSKFGSQSGRRDV